MEEEGTLVFWQFSVLDSVLGYVSRKVTALSSELRHVVHLIKYFIKVRN